MSSGLPPYTPLQEDTEDVYSPVPNNRGYYTQQWPAPAPVYYPPAAPVQQSQTLVINQGTPVIVQPIRHIQSFAGYICLSCFVFWCCGCLFGFIAFVLAMIARDKAVIAPLSARRLGTASLLVSIIGILVGIIAIILVIVLCVVGINVSQTYEDETYKSTCNEIFDGDC